MTIFAAPEDKAGADEGSVRRRVVEGGIVLTIGQLIGYGLKLIGLFLVTRVLGPDLYAPFVAASALVLFLVALVAEGLFTWLLVADPREAAEREAAAIGVAILTSLVLTALVLVAAGPLAAYMKLPAAREIFLVLAVAVPPRLLLHVVLARLDRRLQYRGAAAVEFLGDVGYYCVCTPLVLAGIGALGLAIGFVAQAAVALATAVFFAGALPRPGFEPRQIFRCLRFVLGCSLATFSGRLRGLVNPLAVAPVLGPGAVAIVGMAVSVVELVGFLKNIFYRLALAAFGRAGGDTASLRAAITQGLQVQTLVVGAALLGFGFLGDVLVPLAFGRDWLAMLAIYPYLALAYLVHAQVTMHLAALTALARQRDIVLVNLVHVVLFFAVALWALPRFGLVGYGFGEVAAVPAYGLLHFFLVRRLGSPDYRVAGIWFAGAALGLFWRDIGLWAMTAPFVALATPSSVRLLRQAIVDLRRGASAGPGLAPRDATSYGSAQSKSGTESHAS